MKELLMKSFDIKELVGHLNGQGLHIGIVASRFNEAITKNLVEGAIDALLRHGVDQKNIHLAWVPGAFEIPLIAKKMAEKGTFDAIICLGAVIRGATPHFDYVAGQAASGIANASLETGVPIIFDVLTTNTVEEALERAGTKSGNKGFDGAMSAIEMAHLIKQLNR
jgi:6,7-dimethyl-8-ribityllumazine synthase